RWRAEHTDPERAIARLRAIGLAIGPKENVASHRPRRGLAIVYADVPLAFRRLDYHEAAAADISHARTGHGQGNPDCHRGIHRLSLWKAISIPPRSKPIQVRQIRHSRCRPECYMGFAATGKTPPRDGDLAGHFRVWRSSLRIRPSLTCSRLILGAQPLSVGFS